ncbi:alpha/beta hydrolase family protein [Psychroserpens sp. XS_ASV72]|uniref:alpha/beta hydrolase family protein n=1 Tax=Psychroserpens sp. XS_ASV72 TaxID=3241293 RepID=UPI0035141915
MNHKNYVLNRHNTKPMLWDAFFKEDQMKKPVVIFCHGYKGFKDWGSWDLVAEAFRKQGLFFVKFNFSHNGGTMENPIDFPDLNAFAENNYTKELDDLNDMIDFIVSKGFPFKNEIDTENITLIGHSRGGGISIIKASEDSRIKRLITWASVSDFGSRFGSAESIQQWENDGVKYVINGRTKQEMPHHYQFYEDFLHNTERLNIKRACLKLNIPFLIVHATEDPSVTFEAALNLSSWCPKAKLLEIKGSNHVFGASHPWNATNLPNDLNQVVENSIKFIKN